MRLPAEDGQLIRRYFLGDLTEEERLWIEERIFTDSDFKSHVLLVEDELVEDYAAHLLSAGEAKKFEQHFLTTPEQHRKLRIVNLLKAGAAQAPSAQTPIVKASRDEHLRRFRLPLLTRKGKQAAIIVIVLIAVLSAGLWYAFRNRRSTEDLTRREKLQAEIERLNQPSFPQTGLAANFLAVTLTPSLLRGGSAGPKIVLPQGDTIVQFHLSLPPNEYQRYGVVLVNAKGDEVFSFNRLTVQSLDGQRALILNVPSSAFTSDDYKLKLSGISDSDLAEPIGDYSFRVVTE